MVAFAILAGASIAALAYVRARRAKSQQSPFVCLQLVPNGALLRERASHPLVEYGTHATADGCDVHFRPRAAANAPVELRIVRSKTHWNTRLMEVAGPTQRQPGFFDEGKAHGSYVQHFDRPQVDLIIPAPDDGSIQISFETTVLDLQEGFELAADIAARHAR